MLIGKQLSHSLLVSQLHKGSQLSIKHSCSIGSKNIKLPPASFSQLKQLYDSGPSQVLHDYGSPGSYIQSS